MGFIIIALVAITAGTIGLLTSSAHRPRCRVTVTLISITNDTSGIRQVTLGLTNVGRHAVAFLPTFVLENLSGEWRTSAIPPKAVTLRTNLMGVLPFQPKMMQLAMDKSCQVTLPLPFDDRRWRASFWYLEVLTPLQQALDDLSGGLKARNKQVGSRIVSTDWIEQ